MFEERASVRPPRVTFGALARASALLLSLLVAPLPASALSQGDRTAYEAAFRAADRGQWSAVAEAVAAARDPVLRDVLTWRRMQEAPRDFSFAAIAAFVEAHPDWPGQSVLRRRAEEMATGNEAPEDLLRWFDANPPFTGRGKMLFAEALRGVGRGEGAAQVAREAWVNEFFGEADEKRFLARFGDVLTAELHRKRLEKLLWDGRLDDARSMLRFVDEDHRRLAQARIALQQQTGNVDTLVDRVPAKLQTDPGLVYDRLRWRRLKGMEERAADLLDGPTSDHVRPRKWWRERAILARYYLEKGYVSKAYDISRRHGMKSGGGFAEAEWLAGWIALRFLNEPKAALAHFQRLYDAVSYPISVGRAAYWAGRAAEASGDDKGAHTWYQTAATHLTTYYGQLAAAKLNERPRLPETPRPTSADRETFAANGLIAVAKALAAIGREGDVRPFLYRVNEDADTPGVQVLTAELAQDMGRVDLAVALSRRAALKGAHLIDTAYPIPEISWPGMPEQALVLAIIRQESNFHSGAVSRAGARGLMQLMPATAKLVARQEKLHHDESALTARPEYNVRLGASYLQDLIDRFGGSYPLAIAGYNAGPGRPARWVKEFGDPRRGEMDVVDWIEMIPFSETRNYVQRVLESLQVYRYRLGQTELAFNIEKDLKRSNR